VAYLFIFALRRCR